MSNLNFRFSIGLQFIIVEGKLKVHCQFQQDLRALKQQELDYPSRGLILIFRTLKRCLYVADPVFNPPEKDPPGVKRCQVVATKQHSLPLNQSMVNQVKLLHGVQEEEALTLEQT